MNSYSYNSEAASIQGVERRQGHPAACAIPGAAAGTAPTLWNSGPVSKEFIRKHEP